MQYNYLKILFTNQCSHFYKGSDATPTRVKFRSRKRVYASVAPTTTSPKSNKTFSQPDASVEPSDIHVAPPQASLAPSDIHVAPPSHPDGSQAVEPAIDAQG